MTQSTQSTESASSTKDTLLRLAAIIDSRKGGDPDVSYVSRLFHKGDDAVLKKIGEEATEVVLAAKDVRQGGAPRARRERRLIVAAWSSPCRRVLKWRTSAPTLH